MSVWEFPDDGPCDETADGELKTRHLPFGRFHSPFIVIALGSAGQRYELVDRSDDDLFGSVNIHQFRFLLA